MNPCARARARAHSRCVCYGSAVCNTSRRDEPDRFPQKERETSRTQPRMKNASSVYRHRDGGSTEINIPIVRRHVIDFINRPVRNELRWIDERSDIDRSEAKLERGWAEWGRKTGPGGSRGYATDVTRGGLIMQGIAGHARPIDPELRILVNFDYRPFSFILRETGREGVTSLCFSDGCPALH